jgi:hypothetical protein
MWYCLLNDYLVCTVCLSSAVNPDFCVFEIADRKSVAADLAEEIQLASSP